MKKTITALHIARNSLIINIILTAFKLFAGIFGGSAAMLSDAIHTLSDLAGTLIAMLGIGLGNKKADKNHPYGHERFECVATLVLGLLLLITGLGIGWAGLQALTSGRYAHSSMPGILALTAAILSILTKESLFWYVQKWAKKLDSTALMADAWHSRSDALSSIGSLIGIMGARMGFPIFDTIAALIIAIFIIKTASCIMMDAIGKMTDKACDDETLQKMRQTIMSHPDVEGIDILRTRLFGDRVYVEVEVALNAQLTFVQSHQIAHQVHDMIEEGFPKVKHCEVHANPICEPETYPPLSFGKSRKA